MPLSEIHPPDRPAPRYCPERPFPAYRYVPGLHPHPRRDPAGHSYDPAPRAAHAAWDPNLWRSLVEWLAGVDRFNAFYFWEAHESWEGLWASQPRASLAARTLQGLIQIAAALLKIHLGTPHGAASLSHTGLQKLDAAALAIPTLLGLDLRATATDFHHYFRPLLQRTLPPLDASVPLLRLAEAPHA
ncbi:MAG: DUF309 domain-containing protein [Deltaproteobacteria bacterium]|nr:DUF309 domain-containing protein [Deltaproteobacteria bacterium]